jgi:hypothetical protein
MNHRGDGFISGRRNLANFSIVASAVLSVSFAIIAFVPEKRGARIPVTCDNGKMGYIDPSGRMVIPPKFDKAECFGPDGTSQVKRLKQNFRVNLEKNFPFIRISRNPTHEILSLDRCGKVLERSEFKSEASNCGKKRVPDEFGMIMIREHNSVRWAKEDGTSAFPGTWDMGIDFHGNDPAAVRQNGRWAFISRNGQMITGYDWDHTYGFNGTGRAIVSNYLAWGCIDREGRFLIPLSPIELRPFDDQGISICRKTGYGAVNQHGKIIIPFLYHEMDPFDDFDMARAVIRTGFGNDDLQAGWIDRSGNTVIPFAYERNKPAFHENFENHPLLPVRCVLGSGLIDRKGRTIVPPSKYFYDHTMDPLSPDQFWVVSVKPPYSFGEKTLIPQCYDLNGILIWQGSTLRRFEKSIGVSGIFGMLGVIAYFIARKSRSIPNCPT